ncbi:uncharacterized protein LOC121837151 [Ixodes scapularis]|uniref:uncharacterized protein LOC121837151 n=1 Tax=Ixodes scapularis TaxID=6945 RepID=UPI001C389C0A|nr:uncharacterized protein LOC121837151 [Ixodes scapularis]
MTTVFPTGRFKAAATLLTAADLEKAAEATATKDELETPTSEARGRKVQYNLQNSDEEPLVDGHSLDAPTGSRTPSAEKKKPVSPRTPKPLLKSVEKLRHVDGHSLKKRRGSGKDEERETSRRHPEGGPADGDDQCPRETLPLLEMSEGLPYPVVPRPALIRELSRHHGDPHDLPVPEVNVVPPTPLHADHEARRTHIQRLDTDSL